MSIEKFPSGGHGLREKPYRVDEAPEVKQALAKAEEYAARAASAKDSQERERCERMRRKWFVIADGWRVIAGVDKT
jgi:hypothetical protein